MANPIYRRDQPGPAHRVVTTIWEWLQDVWHSLTDVAPGGGLGVLAILAVAVLAAVALVRRFGPPGRAAQPAAEPLLAGTAELRAADLRRQAETHAGRGEWALAQRAALRALVLDLEERGILRPRPGWTADEVSAAAAPLIGPAAEPLREATRAFDEVWYGGREATAQTYAQVRDLDAELRRMRLAAPALVPPALVPPPLVPPAPGSQAPVPPAPVSR